MAATTQIPFSPDALDTNRRGELSDAQRRNLGALSRYNRRNALSIAAFFVAGAVLVGVFASPTASALLRALVTFICLAIAVFLVLRSITGSDALTRDLRRGRVQSAEGAVGKGRMGDGRQTSYSLDVGDTHFKVARATYHDAPAAGFVRVYFLPRSRRIVNLERVPSAPLPDDLTLQRMLESLAEARSHGRREINEARARLAGVVDAFNAAAAPSAPPPHARDPRPLAEAIVGTWSNGLITVTFSTDGRATTRMFGQGRDGHWSVDGPGRLRADITGREETADAWVAGDQLTIAAEGTGLTLTRESGA